MKKITLLLSLLTFALLINAQTNLLLNPGFETWTGDKPDSWTFSTSGATLAKSTDVVLGASSLQVSATATYWITQVVTAPGGTFDPAKKYEFALNYKLTAGDNTDLRVWHGFITSDPGVTPVVYYDVPKTSADSAKYYWPFHGPDGKSATTGYWGYNAADVTWKNFSYQFNFPAGVKQFSYQIRVYSKATAILDEIYFGEARTAGVASNKNQSLKVYVSNGKAHLNASQNETIEVYNAAGQRVASQKALEGDNSVQIEKGISIIRVGNRVGKVVL